MAVPSLSRIFCSTIFYPFQSAGISAAGSLGIGGQDLEINLCLYFNLCLILCLDLCLIFFPEGFHRNRFSKSPSKNLLPDFIIVHIHVSSSQAGKVVELQMVRPVDFQGFVRGVVPFGLLVYSGFSFGNIGVTDADEPVFIS